MKPDHPDFATVSFIANELEQLAGGRDMLRATFPLLVQDAVDFVIDPVRTARTRISDLDSVEKTFIGLKIEHFLRDFLGIPNGLRDLRIGGLDVDVKNTVRATWMIPPETFSNEEPCVLVMVATERNACSLGVFIARASYLNKPNRDRKRSVRKKSFENIWWLLEGEPLPESRFAGLDMARFRQLRQIRGGAKRTAQFFRENLGQAWHRDVLLGLLHDQLDPMKRVRGNGGARDLLAPEGIALLSGVYNAKEVAELNAASVGRDEFIALKVGKNRALSIAQHGSSSKVPPQNGGYSKL
jgi:hypothetical protein